ncbi:MAG: apolipoprotein N-acyltransferase [Planctomycetaceae bacterium]|nr:apolipoprotein N-acyltransferase [Planctomycetaceae bacterium]
MSRVFVPAILSGVLLWTAFFPLNLGPVAFFALVPWLSLVRVETSRRRRYLAAYLGGVTFFAFSTNWVRVAHPMMYMSWLGLSVVMPVTWVFALDFIRRLDRFGVPLAFAVPVGWVSLEYARMHFPTGFPFLEPLGLQHMIGFGWYFLGYTQHAFLPLIQIADLGGVYAVSFVVAAMNGMLADWVFRTSHRILATLGVLVLFASSLGYGYVRLQHPEFTPGPRVAAIQGSVSQDEKILKGGGLIKTYKALYIQAGRSTPKPDLIVWPETCFPDEWYEVAPGETASPEYARSAQMAAEAFAKGPPEIPVILGLNSIEWEGGRPWKYNSALLLDTEGHKLGRYDKMHLVPFGEYVPLGQTFPFLSVFTPYKHDYACRPGRTWTRFPLTVADGKHYTFGCLICYEDSDTYLARQYAARHPVDFLVNISNDGWFDGTEEHEQHLAICRFRAIEARRSIVRAVNMGISGLIDSDGRVLAIPGETWATSKKMQGVVSEVVPLDTRGSWYAVLGDAVPGVCWLVVVVSFVLAWRKKAAV